jgi:NADH-quinone oxidoreductase subunit J
MEKATFAVLACIAVFGAINVVFRRNPVTAALFLVLTFLALSGLFVLMGSGFLAAIQVIVYAGAIMVLFLFVIMLLNLDRDPFKGFSPIRTLSSLLCAVLGVVALIKLLPGTDREGVTFAETGGDGVAVGEHLFQRAVVPFEALSLLLLMAMAGVVLIARAQKPEPKRTP